MQDKDNSERYLYLNRKRSKDTRINQMDYFDILRLMVGYARQMVLLQIVEDVVVFLKQEEFRFLDLLRGLSNYAVNEQFKESEENRSWEVVGQYLKLASDELADLFQPEDKPLSLSELDIYRLQADYLRQLLMLEMVSVWTRGLQQERYRFSDLLKALSIHANDQVTKNPESSKSWGIVAALLKSAAEEAERQGEELP